MSRAGWNELFATSTVGATIRNSPEWRQLRISAVNMIPAALVLFVFFFEISRKTSRIRRRPSSGS